MGLFYIPCPALYTTLSLLLYYNYYIIQRSSQDAQGKRTHQTSHPLQGADRHAGREGGRQAEQARDCQADVGHDQGEQAAGPREQAVLRPQQEDALFTISLTHPIYNASRDLQTVFLMPIIKYNHKTSFSTTPSSVIQHILVV